MERGRIVVVQKVGDSLAVTIPAEIRRALGIQRGDSLAIEVLQEDALTFRKINFIK